MDKLYEFYGCNDGLYTGLATRFKNDIFELVRDGVAEDFASVEEVFTVFDRIAREATQSLTYKRDYKREYEVTDGTAKVKKKRAARNKARRYMERKGLVRKGDGKDVDHKDSNPSNNSPSNLRVKSASTNRKDNQRGSQTKHMDGSNFLQRPGGLGPTSNRVKPIGSLAPSIPAAYQNSSETIEINRATSLDDVNRTMVQFQKDRGEYAREPIGPTDFQKGNIVPSQQLTGPAGYNHRDQLVIPERPMDMSKGEYLLKANNEINPELRNQLSILTLLPTQNFLSTPDVSQNTIPQNYMMPDSLPLQLPTGPKK